MKHLFTFAFSLVCATSFSQVEIRIVNRTGSFLMNVELEGQKIGSLPEGGSAVVSVPEMKIGPHLKADYRNTTFHFPQSRYAVCGNDTRPASIAQGSFTYDIILLKDRNKEHYLSLAPHL